MLTKPEIKSVAINALNDVLRKSLPEDTPESTNIHDDLNLDSMDLVSVFMILEMECGINLEERLSEHKHSTQQDIANTMLSHITTLQDIVDLFYEMQ